MKKFYAVKNGKKTGIFLSWAECEEQVKGFANARFKGFTSQEEAAAWLDEKPVKETVFYKKKSVSVKKSSEPSRTEELPPSDTDYIIYTDGSCLRNPDGPGGWAAVLIDRHTGEIRELHDGNPSTTNNRMELSAAIHALSDTKESESILLCTDSQYMKNAFTKHWIRNWKRNGWKTAKGTDVLNKDLWLELDALFQTRKVNFQWVKGHAGTKYNERCDELAKEEAMQYL